MASEMSWQQECEELRRSATGSQSAPTTDEALMQLLLFDDDFSNEIGFDNYYPNLAA
ncbi:hypothetical protein [Nereida sp. MMG025]|uniref:hypothetical protein n=1 Tax=Nereida sp. MMG025 TaxID=2909981 RepID=UPI001F22C7FC|nr:hypothetical protein [Nereida sp. MMG025]MCF6445834.1 hypothetical protein [Nereida sp. MMG025]